MVTVSTVCISTATYVIFLQDLCWWIHLIFIHILFMICDYFCKWGFCWERGLSTLLQVQGPGVLLYDQYRCRNDLHEGMLHLQIMHENNIKSQRTTDFFSTVFLEGIIDFECLINVFMLYHIQTSLGSSVKSPITQKNSRDRSVFAQTIQFQKAQTSFWV